VLAPGIDALERSHDASKYGRVGESLVMEATIPSLVDPSLVEDAAAGSHVMSVVVQYTPYVLRDGSWNEAERREGVANAVIGALSDLAPGFASLVREREVLTPLDLERDYGLTGGHPLHGEPGLDQFFLWRPFLGHARYRLVLDGLYLAGSGAHPGGGVTGQPGQNAAREILADLRARRRRR
jgi:phytoene dehydrogenase-like protein